MLLILLTRELLVLLTLGLLQSPAGTPPQSAAPVVLATQQPGPNPVETPQPIVTDAEKIANTRDAIQQGTLAIEKLQKRLDDPEGEYQKAETEFESLNRTLKVEIAKLAKLRKDAKEPEAVALEATIATLQADWQLSKDRFDIAIRQKKVTQEAIAGLKERVASDQQLLNQLEGKAPPHPMPGISNPPPQPTPTIVPPSTTKTTPTLPKPAGTVEPVIQPSVEKPPASPIATLVALPGLPLHVSPTPEPPATPVEQPVVIEENDPVVRQARGVLEARRAELHETEVRLRTAEERVRVMERSVQNADKMLSLEKESVIQAEKSVTRSTEALLNQPPTDATERENLAKKLMETEERLAESRTRVQRITDRVVALNETLNGLKAERDIIAQETANRQQRVNEAENAVLELSSPTAPRNLFKWVINKGPRLFFILLGMLLIHLAVRQFSRHIVRFITRVSQRGSAEDRENRASTLVGVFRYAAGLVVFGGGLVMLMDELGVPVVPLMGGAAVIGLAVAFGAQNLIRDYFTGFMMLMEDQYSVNDVVRIGTIAGLVEQITLRMTVLRDLEGVRHFIPHGAITSVSNLTHGWSRAKMDIPIAYKENVDRVMGVLMQLGRELRNDPVLGRNLLGDPEMLGVESLADSGVVIRFLLKTRPLQQWPIRREMLRRIKNRFDELGIEIPFPHRMVYHRYPDEQSQGVLPGPEGHGKRSVA